MATIRRFEEIEAWCDARLLAGAVYKRCRMGLLGKDYGLREQMQRAAAATMANIAEGFERRNFDDFSQFLRRARGSCAELRSHLYVALDAELITRPAFDELHELADRVAEKIDAFQRYLKETANS